MERAFEPCRGAPYNIPAGLHLPDLVSSRPLGRRRGNVFTRELGGLHLESDGVKALHAGDLRE
jgi:hypothetical protein